MHLIYSIPEIGTQPVPAYTVDLSAIGKTQIETEVLPPARRHWHALQRDCDVSFGMTDSAAQGSFTRPSASQTVILYSYCSTGHNIAQNGIVVLERGSVVAHIAYLGGWSESIVPAEGIGRTGQTKILIVGGGTGQGETLGTVRIIGVSDKDVQKFGSLQTYDDACNASYVNLKKTASILFVKLGAAPVFYSENHESSCAAKQNWIKTGTLEQISLEKDNYEYILLPPGRYLSNPCKGKQLRDCSPKNLSSRLAS